MGRRNEPWYWEARGEWFVKINGKRERLGPDEDAAFRKFHALKAKDPDEEMQEAIQEDSVAAILDDFLGWTQENRAAKTYKGYKDFIESFCKLYPTLRAAELKTSHVTTWLNGQKGWNSTTKRGAITALQRGFNWATKNRGLDRNPIRGMEKPEAKRRTATITPKEFTAILKKTPRPSLSRSARRLMGRWSKAARNQRIGSTPH